MEELTIKPNRKELTFEEYKQKLFTKGGSPFYNKLKFSKQPDDDLYGAEPNPEENKEKER